MTTTLTSWCDRCGGNGCYKDPQCESRICAHLGEYETVEGEDGKPKRRRSRVMPCPQRPCSCKAGQPFRAKLKARVRRQEEQAAAADELLGAHASASRWRP